MSWSVFLQKVARTGLLLRGQNCDLGRKVVLESLLDSDGTVLLIASLNWKRSTFILEQSDWWAGANVTPNVGFVYILRAVSTKGLEPH